MAVASGDLYMCVRSRGEGVHIHHICEHNTHVPCSYSDAQQYKGVNRDEAGYTGVMEMLCVPPLARIVLVVLLVG